MKAIFICIWMKLGLHWWKYSDCPTLMLSILGPLYRLMLFCAEIILYSPTESESVYFNQPFLMVTWCDLTAACVGRTSFEFDYVTMSNSFLWLCSIMILHRCILQDKYLRFLLCNLFARLKIIPKILYRLRKQIFVR